MPRLPMIPEGQQTRNVTDVFSGYNHNLKIADGQYYDTQNLSTEYYPIMADRKKRGSLPGIPADVGGLIDKDALYYVADGKLYLKGSSGILMSGLSEGEKQLVGMGAYICIFPDLMYYNTADPSDKGDMRKGYEGAVQFTVSGDDVYVYNVVDEGTWSQFVGRLKAGKTVTIETALGSLIDGEHTVLEVYADHETYGASFRIDTVEGFSSVGVFGSVKTYFPKLDYVCEASNRLWGCRYGQVGNKQINELYCCALGDFSDWDNYEGTSMDSWTASVGSDGPWTGCINYMGYPTFFKEDRLHRIAISSVGAHQVTETACRGVQEGSWRSLQIVNETLYYKSPLDVCAYQGGFPTGVSEALGDIRYSDAVAGVFGDRYYISMRSTEDGKYHLFVFNTGKGLWIRQDDLQAISFATVGNELYCAPKDGGILAMYGSEGEIEDHVDWYAESGILYYEYPDRKYISRFNLRMKVAKGGRIRIFLEYDSSGRWEKVGEIVQFSGLNTVTVPVRPHRCDHLRIRIEGRGETRIFSWARILEVGSDY